MAEHALEQNEDQGLLARWRQTEPLRLWLYGIAVPLLLALVGYGVLTDQHSSLWLAVVQAILLGGGVEGARQFIVSPATARSAVLQAATVTDEDGEPVEVDVTAARHALIRYRIPS